MRRRKATAFFVSLIGVEIEAVLELEFEFWKADKAQDLKISKVFFKIGVKNKSLHQVFSEYWKLHGMTVFHPNKSWCGFNMELQMNGRQDLEVDSTEIKENAV